MNTVLLLGAGASIPFYKSMLTSSHLKTVILDRCRWENLVDRYTNSMGSDTNMVNIDEVFQVLEKIRKEYPDYNFEQIIEFIDEISSFKFDPDNNNKNAHTNHNFMITNMPGIEDNIWDCIPFLFRQLIAEEVALFYNNLQSYNYNDLIELQSKFIASLTKGQSFNLITLNYDESIFDSITNLNFITGFDNNGRFDVKSFKYSNRTISFLHGNTRFRTDSDGIYFHIDGVSANNQRLANINASNRTETQYLVDSQFAYTFNTFITTGQKKESSFDRNPYDTYYDKFISDCRNANKIYVVGYSFSDPHINKELSGFLHSSSDKQIVIVDYLPNTRNIKHQFQSSGTLMNKIYTELSSSSFDLRDSDRIENDFQINMYSKINNQITLYKDGYINFLRELSNVTI
ncbi:MAG: hypothetical protein FMNOHCHN_00906 [Ignavibacteriaceae bacterium]|nr:hypothetical protein [Ignavibacteriaceae bacterium]